MLSQANMEQRKLLENLHLAWLDFRDTLLDPGVELTGQTWLIAQDVGEGIEKLSQGPEIWAGGSCRQP